MVDQPSSSTLTVPTVEQPTVEQLMRGYRWRSVCLPDGREISVQVPLTAEDFLNPQEGDMVPENTFHSTATGDLHDMLRLRYAADPTVAVFRDLIVRWGSPACPIPPPTSPLSPTSETGRKIAGPSTYGKKAPSPS